MTKKPNGEKVDAETRADVSEGRADESQFRADKQEIRIDHYEQKAAADKFAADQQAILLANHVDELVIGVRGLAEGVLGLKHAEHRRNKLLVIASILVFAFGVVFLLNFQKSFENQATLKNQAEQIKAISRNVLTLTGCKEKDTPAHCKAYIAEVAEKASKQEGAARLEAVDCIVRSIVAGDSHEATDQKCKTT